MAWRARLEEAFQKSRPLLVALAVVASIIAIIWLFPARTAAVLFGIMLAAVLRFTLLRDAPRTETALLWMGIGVASDAAYARLNDLGPVTIANALMKVVDAIVKLVEPMIRSFTLLPPDFRMRLATVTPDFVWAFILALIVLIAYAMWSPRK